MLQTDVKIRVRYNETDKMGIVHHSNYVYYYEMARTEMMRRMGLSYREMEERGVMLVVREVHSVYYAPAHYDEILNVRVRMLPDPKVKVTFEYEIFNEAGTLLNTGQVVLASVNATTRRPCRVPQWFLDLSREERTLME